MTASSSPAGDVDNLITNLSWRSSGLKGPFDETASLSIDSYYRVDKAALSSNGFKMAVTFDLKDVYFQHSVLFI